MSKGEKIQAAKAKYCHTFKCFLVHAIGWPVAKATASFEFLNPISHHLRLMTRFKKYRILDSAPAVLTRATILMV